jgi:AraC-like DNA-binding protein
MGMSENYTIFDWSNFNEHSKYLLGGDAEPEWIIDSPQGTASNYNLHAEVGSGRMEFVALARGLRVIVFDCAWADGRTFYVRDGDWIRFNFSLSIDIVMHLSKTKLVNAATPSWRIINNLPGSECVEIIPAHSKTVWVTICCMPPLLSDLAGITLDDMPDLLRSAILNDTHDSFHELFDFTARLNTITADIIRTELTGGLRVSYIEARSIELLCLALDYVIHSNDEPARVHLSTADEMALHEAMRILLLEFVDPPSITALSRRLGLNRNKLYYGFKALHATTISEFIQDQRLDEGKRLLCETDLSVSEIADRVGFRHQCNFSTAMKKRFNLTPSQIRR